MTTLLTCAYAQCSAQCTIRKSDGWRLLKDELERCVRGTSNPLIYFNRVAQEWVDMLCTPSGRGDGHAVTRMFDTFSRSGKCPPEKLLNEMVAEAAREMHYTSTGNLARLAKAVGNLAIDPGTDFLEALTGRIENTARSFAPINARMLLQGMAMIDAVQENLYGEDRYDMHKTYRTLTENNQFRKAIRRNWSPIQGNLLADVERWFTGKTDTPYVKEPESKTNKFEKKASKLLHRIGINILPRIDKDDINHSPDIHGIYKGTEIHIECDGPTHMIECCDDNQMYLNGQSILQTRLLRQSLPGTIIRMPLDIFELNRDKPNFWNCLLDYIEREPKDKAIFFSGIRRPTVETIGCSSSACYDRKLAN